MYESYINLTPNELHNRLLKRKLHPHAIDQIKAEVAKIKETIRVDKITREARKKQWAILLDPLRYELNNAKVGRAYDLDDADRVEAFDAYILVMETLLSKFATNKHTLGQTPIQLAKERELPNNGDHWVDWVPMRVRDRVSTLFHQLPTKAKAKRKVPFQRTTPLDQHAKARERLLSRTTKEIQNLERKNLITTTEERTERMAQMRTALKKLDGLAGNEHIPATWTGLL